MRIAVLEDDPVQQDLYRLWLDTAQHGCEFFGTVKSFMEALQQQTFDLLILDWMLPDGSGEAVLRWVRANTGWQIPVIFVTSRDSEVDIVKALRSGADDYLVKPTRCLEFLARIESLARRVNPPRTLQFGAFEIEEDLRQIRVNGTSFELTQKEFELASYLFRHPGKLLSRVHLLEKLWGLNADVDTRTVDTHVSRIRRKLEIRPENGWQIIPVYGYGYRMEKTGLVTDGTAQA